MCSSIGTSLERCAGFYTHSVFPNNVSLSLPLAQQVYNRYDTIVSTLGCSIYIEVYICLALAPQCDPSLPSPSVRPRPPCASFCDNVKAQCNDAINDLGGFGIDVDCLLANCNRQVSNFLISHAYSLQCLIIMSPQFLYEINYALPLEISVIECCFTTTKGYAGL